MKKLLGILVLGLLWCNVGVAEVFKLKNCYQPKYMDAFPSAQIEKHEFVIDTDLKTIKHTYDYTDDHFKILSGSGLEQKSTYHYKITNNSKKVIKSLGLKIYLKKKKVIFDDDPGGPIKCE
jgi:hypothetical protein